MFNRIFQDCEGCIEELAGKNISALYSLDDKESGNVYLLWLQAGPENKWYRIFIDGWYCGIDEYEECMIESDQDDFVTVLDLTSKYKNESIVRVQVREPNKLNYHIVLSVYLNDSTIELVCEAVDGNCVLVKNA